MEAAEKGPRKNGTPIAGCEARDFLASEVRFSVKTAKNI